MPSGLTIVAYLVVAAIAFALLVMIAWALHRLAIVVEVPRAAEQEARASRKERHTDRPGGDSVTGAVTLLADHGELVSAIPFVMPAFLIVGALFAMRAIERRRDTPPSE